MVDTNKKIGEKARKVEMLNETTANVHSIKKGA